MAQISVERLALVVLTTVVAIGLGVLAASSNLRTPTSPHTIYTEHANGTQTFITTGSYIPLNYTQTVALWLFLIAIIFALDVLILTFE